MLKYCEGDLHSKIAFVGEAPGVEEEKTGRPFIGASGKHLRKLMQRAGINPARCYITNVVKAHPPRNDITKFIDLSRKKVLYTKEYDTFYSLFKEEMSKCTANVVVAVGAVSLWALCGLKQVTKRRGSIYHAKSDFDYRKVIPIIHPAAALRKDEFSWFIALDLMKVARESNSPSVVVPTPELNLNPTVSEISSYLNGEFREISFDIEVAYGHVSHISFAKDTKFGLCIPFFDDGVNRFSVEEESYIWRQISRVLGDEKIKKIGQNISFDIQYLFNEYGIITRNYEDTMIAQKIIYPDFPVGLDFITSVYTNYQYYKDEGKKWKSLDMNVEAFRRYNALDSLVCIEAFPKQLKDLSTCNMTQVYERQRNLIDPIVYMENRGVLIDVEAKRKLSEESARKIDELEDAFYKAVGRPRETGDTKMYRSPAQLNHYFYSEKCYPPVFKTVTRSTGRKERVLTTDENAIKKLIRCGSVEAQILRDLRAETKAKSTYYDMKIDSDNRMRCSFNPVGTKQGRLSSSETIFDTGGNMQNLPPEFKKLMIPDPGYLLVNVDKARAENKVVAYIANDQTMIRAFEEGIDLHKLTGSLIFNKPIEEVSDEPGSSPIGGGRYSERFWAKKCNHSLNYDFGWMSFSQLYEVSAQEAKHLIDKYHQSYPSVRQWHRRIQEKLHADRTLVNCSPFNRPRRFLGRMSDSLYKEAYSYIPQSTVADLVNQWGVCYIYYELSKKYECELLNTVHDSVMFQIPMNKGVMNAVNCITDLVNNLNQPLSYEKREFVIETDIQIGFNAAKYKEGKNEMGLKDVSLSNLAEEVEATFKKFMFE